MTRHHIEFIPRRSWEPGVDPADQRWTRTPNVFVGTDEQASLECSELEVAYDRAVTFRAVPIPSTEDEIHYCAGCGGDLRIRLGKDLSCTCPVALASTTGVRWVEGKAS